MTTNFSQQPRRDDPQAAMVVQKNVEQLRDAFDAGAGLNLSGAATVPNAATTVTVVHNYGSLSYRAVATPKLDPGGRWWIAGQTASQFVITLQVAAPPAGVPFDWILRGF